MAAWLTGDEAGRWFGVSPSTVRNWVADRGIRCRLCALLGSRHRGVHRYPYIELALAERDTRNSGKSRRTVAAGRTF